MVWTYANPENYLPRSLKGTKLTKKSLCFLCVSSCLRALVVKNSQRATAIA